MSDQGSTAIALTGKDKYLALGGGSATAEMIEAMESVSELEQFGPGDLTRVKMPSGGGTIWEVPDGLGGVEGTKEITGVLCYVQKSGVLWPSEEPQPGAKPVLRTYDLKRAEQVGPIPDHMMGTIERYRIPGTDKPVLYDWEKLPYNQFGSSTKEGSNAKLCKEQRVLFILREGDMYPTVVTVQPGSLKAWRAFFLNLPKTQVPTHRVIVQLTLEKIVNPAGKPYSRIVPKVVGKLDKETGDMVKAKFTDPLSKIAKQVADEESAPLEGDADSN